MSLSLPFHGLFTAGCRLCGMSRCHLQLSQLRRMLSSSPESACPKPPIMVPRNHVLRGTEAPSSDSSSTLWLLRHPVNLVWSHHLAPLPAFLSLGFLLRVNRSHSEQATGIQTPLTSTPFFTLSCLPRDSRLSPLIENFEARLELSHKCD